MSFDLFTIFDGFLEQTPDSVWILDLTGRFLRVSKKKAENHGFKDPKKMIGKMFDDFMQPEEALQVRLDIAEMLETSNKVTDKIQRLERDNKIIFYSLSMFPIFGNGGKVIAIGGTSRDISIRIAVEENMKSFYETAAHDIKNPLVFCNGNLRRVIAGKVGFIDENAKATLENLLLGYDRAEKECEETLIRMSSLGLGEKTLVAKNRIMDVGLEILMPVLAKHSQNMDEKGMIFDNRLHSIPPGEVKLKTYSKLLYSIFDNLIGNAAKYGKINGIISAGYHIDIEKEIIIFNVYNDGDPLSEDYVNEGLGKKFQRDSPDDDGTGIGIYSVIESVKMLDGKFWYQETNSGHPNFLFSLPLSDLIKSKKENG